MKCNHYEEMVYDTIKMNVHGFNLFSEVKVGETDDNL